MTVKIYVGHCLDILEELPSGVVQCVVTSPPYWGLRDYNLPPVEWPSVRYRPMLGLAEVEVAGCAEGCQHEWGEHLVLDKRGLQVDTSTTLVGPQRADSRKQSNGQYCQLCGGWRGSLGLEPRVEMYVAHLVAVFRELKRVLRDDGTCWLNLGDSYNSGTQFNHHSSGLGDARRYAKGSGRGDWPGHRPLTPGLKPKDLIGIPWRVTFALQADGWWLRSAPPWLKGNAMPESVKDRCTTAHEMWFQLTKSARYYADMEAVRVASSPGSAGNRREFRGGGSYTGGNSFDNSAVKENRTPGNDGQPSGRNRRTSNFFHESLNVRIAEYRAYLAHLEHVRDNGGMLLSEQDEPLALVFNTRGFKGAHFATFNTELITPLVKCSTSERGCCPECKAPWVRVVEKTFIPQQDVSQTKGIRGAETQKPLDASNQWQGYPRGTTAAQTTGWTPTCTCYNNRNDWVSEFGPTVPCLVLDPFGGAGTTGLVCERLGVDSVLIELNPEYALMAKERIVGEAPMLNQVEVV